MPTQAIIPVTPGSGLNLDSVSLVIGPATVYRETMVIADPSNATYLATVTSGGALNVTDAAVEACITADVLAVSLPTAQITTLTPPSAADIASAIVSNPPTTFDGIVTNAGTFAVQDQHTSAGAAGYQYLTDGTNVIGVSAHPLYVQGTISIGSGPFAVTQSTSPWIVAGGGTAGSSGTAVLTIQGIGGGTAVPVSGTFYQATQPVSIASGQVASGAFASGSIASGAIASGAIAAGAAAAGAFADGSVYVRSNAAATFPVTATIAAAQTIAVTNAGTFAVQAVGTLTNNNAAPAATNVGVLSALANAANPSFTEGKQVALSVDLSGHQRVVATGAAPSGAAVSGNPVYVAGQDGSGNAQPLPVTNLGGTVGTQILMVGGINGAGQAQVISCNSPGGSGDGLTIYSHAQTEADGVTNAPNQFSQLGNGKLYSSIYSFLFNGATWDRHRSAGVGNAVAATGLSAAVPYVQYNTTVPAPAATSILPPSAIQQAALI